MKRNYLNKPREYLVKLPNGGIDLMSSMVRATHAVIVRRSDAHNWHIHSLYYSEAHAKGNTAPERFASASELTQDEIIKCGGNPLPGIFKRVWEHHGIVLVYGYVERI